GSAVLGVGAPAVPVVRLSSAATAGVSLAPFVAVFRMGNEGGVLNLPVLLLRQLRQHSPQPVRAIPAQTRPIIPTPGFLPLGFPFPVERRDTPRQTPARPCPGFGSPTRPVVPCAPTERGGYVVVGAGKVKGRPGAAPR